MSQDSMGFLVNPVIQDLQETMDHLVPTVNRALLEALDTLETLVLRGVLGIRVQLAQQVEQERLG